MLSDAFKVILSDGSILGALCVILFCVIFGAVKIAKNIFIKKYESDQVELEARRQNDRNRVDELEQSVKNLHQRTDEREQRLIELNITQQQLISGHQTLVKDQQQLQRETNVILTELKREVMCKLDIIEEQTIQRR